MNAIKKKINPILAIALVSSLASSILAIQLSTSDDTLFHAGHNSAIPQDSSHVASAASLPLPVDFHYKIKEKAGDAAEGTRYAEIDEEFINTEIHCEFCTHITVKPGPKGQNGFAYVSDTELDLSAAKSVRFFVMGGDGGEKVKFQVAGKSSAAAEGIGKQNSNGVNASSPPGLFKDKQFALSTEAVTLKDDWTPLSVDLSKVPKEKLKGVKYPFAIEMSQMRGTQEFFIKHVIYETEEATLNTIPASEQGSLNVTALNATALDSNATILDSNETGLNDTSVSSATENATDGGDDDTIANRTSDGTLTEPEEQEEETEQTDDGANNNTAITDDNNTSTGETADETQTQIDDVAPPQSNRTEINGDGDETDDAEDDALEINSPPVARANENIIGYPGDVVILDGLQSFDEDATDRLEYEWTQSDGPDLEITDEDTATPTLGIPSDIEEDSEAVIDLVVSDGKDASEKDSVTLFIDHVEALDDLDEEDEQIQTKALRPDSDEESQWELSECDDLVDCLSDGKKTTATVAGSTGELDIGKTDMLSFEDLAADLQQEGEEIDIKYIVIEVDASKSEETGYIRLHVDSSAADGNNDEEPYESNAISIVSGNMEEYRLILETEPTTDEEWTADSVDSIIAGYSYAGGQSEVEVSDMTIRVFYTSIADDSGERGEDKEVEEESSVAEAGEQEDDSSAEEEEEETVDATNADVNGNMTG